MHIHSTVSQEISRENPHFCLRRDDLNLPPSPQGFLNTTEKLFIFRPLRYYDNKLPYIIYSAAQHGHLLLIVSAGTNIHMYLSVCSNTPQNATVVFLYRRLTASVRGRLRVPHHHHFLHHYERVQVIITKPTNEPKKTNTMISHVDGQPVLFVTFTQSSLSPSPKCHIYSISILYTTT
jgi:hypothetical protein